MEQKERKQFDKDLLKKTVALNGTDEELSTFIYLCQEYNLDPFKKEIFFIKQVGRPATIITSRDGYLKIANEHDQFDGLESDVIYEGDKLFRRDSDGSIRIEYGESHIRFDNDKLMGAFCNIYRKDRSKAIGICVSVKDYKRPSNVWSTYPNAMILKVAESMALKRAFALSGLVSQEEIGITKED